MKFNIMEGVLKKINRNRISPKLAYLNLHKSRWHFKKREEYLLQNLKIEFENPEFWYYLGIFFYDNYELNNLKPIFLENALFCFNKPFENNKNKGKTILCDSFQESKDLFSLTYSEYIDFLNMPLDYLIVIYKQPVFYEGFSLPNSSPTKPEIIERFEVIINADYNEQIEKNEKVLIQQIKDNEVKRKLLITLKRHKKIRIKDLAKILDYEQSFLEKVLEKLVFNNLIEGNIKGDLLYIKKIPEIKGKSTIYFSEKGECLICRKIITEKSLMCSNCFSKFHIKCFLNWIDTKQSCPLCQKKLEFF
ncbi:MAG: RING finger domain-containing protein [Candidatus Helarchaeota archaeon]